MTDIKVIFNPTADKGAAIHRLEDVSSRLNKLGLSYDITITEHPWHAAEITRKAVADGYKTVVAVGGDGTINEVLNGLMIARQEKIGDAVMGVLPIGRGNDFAFGMGIPLDLNDSCNALAAGTTRRIDVGWCRGGLYPDGRYFGNGIGIGFDAMVGFLANQGRISGFLGYLVAAIKTIFLFKTPMVEIEVNGESITEPDLMISAMNGRRMGGGFMMAPDAKTDDGQFDIAIVNDIPRIGMLKLITAFMKGAQFGHPAVRFLQTNHLLVRSIKGILPTHVDGETICVDCTELEVKLHPSQIDLIYEPAVPHTK